MRIKHSKEMPFCANAKNILGQPLIVSCRLSIPPNNVDIPIDILLSGWDYSSDLLDHSFKTCKSSWIHSPGWTNHGYPATAIGFGLQK